MNKEENCVQYSSLFVFGCSCFIAFISLIFSMQTRTPSENITKYLPFIPSHFLISENYLHPIKENEDTDKNTFTNAITHLFESYLKYEAIYKKIIKDKKSFYKLSKSKINDAINEGCKNLDVDICDLPFEATTALQYFKQIPKLNNSILPQRYKDFDLAEENSLKFTFKQTNFSRSSEGIRDLLYRTKRPLLLTMPQIVSDYYFKCNDAEYFEPVFEYDECTDKTLICPSHLLEDSEKEEYCGLISTTTILESGDSFVPHLPAIARASSNTQSFVVVGYNNDLVATGFQHLFQSMGLPKGGFIVKNNQGDINGHTLDYLIGNQSLAYDKSICGSNENPNSWIPCRRPNCTDENYLECIDADEYFCKKDYLYALVKDIDENGDNPIVTEDLETGLTTSYVYEFERNGSLRKKTKISSLPFWRLGEVFSPRKQNHPSHKCGYSFIPYELIDLSASIEKGESFTLALDLPVIFQSFPDDIFMEYDES